MLEVDIPHVDPKSPGLWELLTLYYLGVLLEGFLKLVLYLWHLIVLVLYGQVEHHRIGELNVYAVDQVSLFLLLAQCFFLYTGFLSFLQGVTILLF